MIPERVREDFPIPQQRMHDKPLVYLDSAATSQKPRIVLEALTRYYEEYNANVHRGIYFLAEKATQAYEDARARVAGRPPALPSLRRGGPVGTGGTGHAAHRADEARRPDASVQRARDDHPRGGDHAPGARRRRPGPGGRGAERAPHAGGRAGPGVRLPGIFRAQDVWADRGGSAVGALRLAGRDAALPRRRRGDHGRAGRF